MREFIEQNCANHFRYIICIYIYLYILKLKNVRDSIDTVCLQNTKYKIQSAFMCLHQPSKKKHAKLRSAEKKFRLNPTQVGTSREFFFFLEVASYLYNYNFPSCAVVRFGIAEFRLRFRRLLRCVHNSKRRAERHD